MGRTAVLAGLLLPLVGCAAAELHAIAPVARLTEGGVEAEITITRDAGDEGAWLARSVYETSGFLFKARRLLAIEILFCPMKKGDFSDCRQGIGWSSSKNPLAGR